MTGQDTPVEALVSKIGAEIDHVAPGYGDVRCELLRETRKALKSQSAEIARLTARLEVPEPPFEAYDGIECRDETIRGLDAKAARYLARAEAAEARAEDAEADRVALCHMREIAQDLGYESVLEALEALEQAEAELSRCDRNNCFGQKVDGVARWVREERLQEAELEARALREALAPFARIGAEVNDNLKDNDLVTGHWAVATARDLRRAAEVFKPSPLASRRRRDV